MGELNETTSRRVADSHLPSLSQVSAFTHSIHMTPYESHPKMEGQVCIWHFIKPVVQPGSRHLGALGAPGQGGQDDGAPGQSGSGLFYQMCSDKPMCFPDFSWGMIYKRQVIHMCGLTPWVVLSGLHAFLARCSITSGHCPNELPKLLQCSHDSDTLEFVVRSCSRWVAVVPQRFMGSVQSRT